MIKAYIFDQDGTLYPKKNKLTVRLRERTKQWISEKLNLSKLEIERVYEKLSEEFPHPYHGFLSLGLSPEQYHKEVFDIIDPKRYLDRDEKLVNLFKRIPDRKFIVTLASLNYSIKLQRRLGIHGLVENTTSAIDYPLTYSKSEAYISIRDSLGLDSSEICVIGDNLVIDILPALENGFRSVLIGRIDYIRKNLDCIDTIYDLDSLLKIYSLR